MGQTVGFYALLPTNDEKGYLGALLVTDEIGKPEEFRVTYPVKPTPVQRFLYGQSLIPHLGIELCGIPLYEALKQKPDIILVQDQQLVGIAIDIDCLVARITRLGETLEIKDAKAGPTRIEIPSRSGRFDPLAVDIPSSYKSDKSVRVQELLSAFSEQIDLIEPFERIALALKELATQNPDFA